MLSWMDTVKIGLGIALASVMQAILQWLAHFVK